MKIIKTIVLILGRLLSFIFPPLLINKLKSGIVFLSSGYYSRFFAYIGDDTILGTNIHWKGCKYISIGSNTKIGEQSIITAWDSYSHSGQTFIPSLIIGNNCSIGKGSHISCINSIKIGDNVLTGPYVLINDNAHGATNRLVLDIAPIERQLVSKGVIVIEDNVWIGQGAIILSNVTIGKGAIIAANAVVTHNVPAYSVVAGNPAKIIKQL